MVSTAIAVTEEYFQEAALVPACRFWTANAVANLALPKEGAEAEEEPEPEVAPDDTVRPGAMVREPFVPAVWWQLLWCSQHCFEEGKEEYRRKFANCVRARGGRLLCVKKTARLPAMIAGQRPACRALLLEWRDVQRWLQAYRECEPRCEPALIVVRCRTQLLVTVAQGWFRRRVAPSIKQHFCVDLGPLDEFLALLEGMLPAGMSTGAGAVSDVQAEADDAVVLRGTASTAAAAAVANVAVAGMGCSVGRFATTTTAASMPGMGGTLAIAGPAASAAFGFGQGRHGEEGQLRRWEEEFLVSL